MGKYANKNKRWSKRLYYGTLAILLIIFCVSGYFILSYVLESRQTSDSYDDLSAMVESIQQEQATEETTPPPTDAPMPTETIPETEPTEPTEPPMLPEYAVIYEMNPDTVGWIRIEGTPIDYPVMQTPEDPNHYLRRDFNHRKNKHGCIYADEDCDVFKPSDNVTIYGHFMQDGTMFYSLGNYLDADFLKRNPYIQFDTLTHRRTYEIFAVFKTSATIGKGLAYHNFIDAYSEKDFDWFIGQCKELSFHDTGITPEYGDKIICLSTCEYTLRNGRLVVAAVLREDMERE